MKELEFIYKRSSIRKFKDEPLAAGHLEEIIKAAAAAPSGKNLQTWHFVVIQDKTKIQEIAAIIERKNEALSAYLKDEAKIKAFRASVRYHTVFKSAPVLILVYAGPYPSVAEMFLEAGIMPPEEARTYDKPNPSIQTISAAMENLLLAATALGYGTCWMSGPAYAAAEISSYINFDQLVGKKDYFLAALTPLGIPLSTPEPSPVPRGRKPLAEVLTII
ncbi:MAG: nitroreductase family protein [Sporomusaceae bacterium]|jgi:nitroreductase|nr:nitroreductase family protein [Sporomusaceae bacterium]